MSVLSLDNRVWFDGWDLDCIISYPNKDVCQPVQLSL